LRSSTVNMVQTSRKKKGGAVKKGVVGKSGKKDWKTEHAHLFSKNAKDFRVGGDVLPVKRDLSRFVRWPRYVRLQRQKSILKKRLKVPPVINQFNKTLEKNQAANLFRLLSHYRPESVVEKKNRLLEKAKQEEKAGDKKAALKPEGKPRVLKYGINHITDLVESKKAKLVVIAHDVDPIEIVLWLPALCRKMDVPYCIVKGKARLGQLVYKKNATAVALTEVNKDDAAKLAQIIAGVNPMYKDDTSKKVWGGGIMGIKAQHATRKQEKQAAAERIAKANLM